MFQHIAVSTCCNCRKISASGAIVEDEQSQCPLQAVMVCYSIPQQVVQLWKMCNCSVCCRLLCYATVYLSKWCNCGRCVIAVSVAGCYAMLQYTSASGAIVEDVQFQHPLQAVMLCYSIFQQVVHLWKLSNCIANNLSPFPLTGNVIVQGSIGCRHLSSPSLLTSISPSYLPIITVKVSVIQYVHLI